MDIERPAGVTVISILYWIGGILGLLGALLFSAAVSAVGSLGPAGAMGFITFLVGVWLVTDGAGLWKVKKWSWWAAIATGILHIASIFYAITTPDSLLEYNSPILTILIQLIVLTYLLAIRELFLEQEEMW